MIKLQFVLQVFFTAAACGYIPAFTDHKQDADKFTIVKVEDGITLYEKWTTISTNEFARVIKATFSINTTIDSTLSLLRNGEKGVEWNANASEFTVLLSDTTWITYIQYDLPWPLENQDCIIQYHITQQPGKYKVNFNSTTHQDFPVLPNVKRIPFIEGSWLFTSSDRGTDVEYYITTSPSKTLPRLITDPIVRNTLFKTLTSFRKLLQEK